MKANLENCTILLVRLSVDPSYRTRRIHTMSESNRIINSILHRTMMQHNDCLFLEMQEMNIQLVIVNIMKADLEQCPRFLLVERMLSIATIILPLSRHV
jgi:hypothetical protein